MLDIEKLKRIAYDLDLDIRFDKEKPGVYSPDGGYVSYNELFDVFLSGSVSYAIMNMRTGKWLYGTDYRHNPPKQRTRELAPKLFTTVQEAEAEMIVRKCGKDYKIIEVTVTDVS